MTHKNPIDSLKLGDILDWLKSNKLATAAILGLGGANLMPTKIETNAERIVLSATEYNNLILGMMRSCPKE